MIIYFMRKFPDGTPTEFKEKILSYFKYKRKEGFSRHEMVELLTTGLTPKFHIPKYHTMRKSFRIKAGMMLDLAYWSGRPYHTSPEKFVEKTPCISTQEVQIVYNSVCGMEMFGKCFSVIIDGKHMDLSQIEVLARNDGFEGIQHFLNHFNKSERYNIIHFTSLRY